MISVSSVVVDVVVVDGGGGGRDHFFPLCCCCCCCCRLCSLCSFVFVVVVLLLVSCFLLLFPLLLLLLLQKAGRKSDWFLDAVMLVWGQLCVIKRSDLHHSHQGHQQQAERAVARTLQPDGIYRCSRRARYWLGHDIGAPANRNRMEVTVIVQLID